MTWTEIKPCPQFPDGGYESVVKDGEGSLTATIYCIGQNSCRMGFHYENNRYRRGSDDALAIAGGEIEYHMPAQRLFSLVPQLILADIRGVAATSLNPSPWRQLCDRLSAVLVP